VKINWIDVPASDPGKPMVFVIVAGKIGSADLLGLAMTSNGAVLGEHISSNTWWLRQDLVEGDYAQTRMAANYPGVEEIDAALIEDWSTAPSWIREANDQWAAAQVPADA
jgi:hypothetical protein